MALQVGFNGSGSSGGGTETIVSYDWDFGDGNIGSGVTTSHTYSAEGDYNVSLTVTNSFGPGLTHTSTQCVRATLEKKIVTFNSVPADANVTIIT